MQNYAKPCAKTTTKRTSSSSTTTTITTKNDTIKNKNKTKKLFEVSLQNSPPTRTVIFYGLY